MFFKITFFCIFLLSFPLIAEDDFDFYLRDQDNKAVYFKDFFNKALNNRYALVFFQTTCMPCLEEIKYFSSNLTIEQKKQVILINVNEKMNKVMAFRKRHNIKFVILFDKYAMAKKSLNIKNIPSIVFPRISSNILWEGANFPRIKNEFRGNINKENL